MRQPGRFSANASAGVSAVAATVTTHSEVTEVRSIRRMQQQGRCTKAKTRKGKHAETDTKLHYCRARGCRYISTKSSNTVRHTRNCHADDPDCFPVELACLFCNVANESVKTRSNHARHKHKAALECNRCHYRSSDKDKVPHDCNASPPYLATLAKLGLLDNIHKLEEIHRSLLTLHLGQHLASRLIAAGNTQVLGGDHDDGNECSDDEDSFDLSLDDNVYVPVMEIPHVEVQQPIYTPLELKAILDDLLSAVATPDIMDGVNGYAVATPDIMHDGVNGYDACDGGGSIESAIAALHLAAENNCNMNSSSSSTTTTNSTSSDSDMNTIIFPFNLCCLEDGDAAAFDLVMLTE